MILKSRAIGLLWLALSSVGCWVRAEPGHPRHWVHEERRERHEEHHQEGERHEHHDDDHH